MQWTERILWLTVIALLAAMLFWVRSDMKELSSWINMQNDQLEEIDALLDIAEKRAATIGQSGHVNIMLPDYEIRMMQGNGLENPLEDLKSDLMSNPQLIPYDPVLGGTMRFHSASDIIVLPGGWVYAIFEDGHINGALLLEYTISQGTISWSVFKHQLF
ncbi:MAG: hypothetical protein JJU41_02050 [Bacteroidetes bacterium]|nr:hypothetical protein [Bacteroidota bacterium]MCH8524199.1 hypothetical protein [Balneolales bacterium]